MLRSLAPQGIADEVIFEHSGRTPNRLLKGSRQWLEVMSKVQVIGYFIPD
jgi:hypothetical protein